LEAEEAAAEAGEAPAEQAASSGNAASAPSVDPPPVAVRAALAQAALIDLGHGDFVDHARKRIGKIHSVGTGNAKKATCKVHSHCVCWVTPKIGTSTAATLMQDLEAWLSEAAGESPASAATHRASAYHVKVRYGMKPAKPPGVP
jgi:hypothetical protein